MSSYGSPTLPRPSRSRVDLRHSLKDLAFSAILLSPFATLVHPFSARVKSTRWQSPAVQRSTINHREQRDVANVPRPAGPRARPGPAVLASPGRETAQRCHAGGTRRRPRLARLEQSRMPFLKAVCCEIENIISAIVLQPRPSTKVVKSYVVPRSGIALESAIEQRASEARFTVHRRYLHRPDTAKEYACEN